MNIVPHCNSPPRIENFPSEIVTEIFACCLPSQLQKPKIQDAPVLLGRVCRAWRAIAYSTPLLWTNIYLIITDRRRAVDLSVLSTWLERSRSSPLDVTIRDRDGSSALLRGPLWNPWDIEGMLAVLAPHCSRWRSLHCNLLRPDAQLLLSAVVRFGGLPLLKELDFNSSPECRNGISSFYPLLPLSICPRLASLSSDIAKLVCDTEDTPYALKTIYGCPKISLADCFDLIQNSPSLGFLSANCTEITQPSRDGPPFTHLSLTRLCITLPASNQDVAHFFDSVTCPSLAELDLQCKISNENQGLQLDSNALSRFLHRSSPPLEILDLKGFGYTTLLKCLKYTPRLRHLHSAVDLSGDVLLHALTLRHGDAISLGVDLELNLVPCLRTVTLICTPDVSPSNLAEMIISRWGGPSGSYPETGCLRFVTMWLVGIRRGDLITPELEQCTQEGLYMTIHRDTSLDVPEVHPGDEPPDVL